MTTRTMALATQQQARLAGLETGLRIGSAGGAAAPAFLADDGRNLAFITSAWPDARRAVRDLSHLPACPRSRPSYPDGPAAGIRAPSFGPASCGSTVQEKVNPMPGIVVGFDGSSHPRRALEWAMKEAAVRHASLTVIAVHEVVVDYWGTGLLEPEDHAEAERVRQATQVEVD